MCRAFLRFSDVANLIVFATWRLGPLLRSVQDTGDLNRFLSDAVNNDERQAGDNHLSRVGLAAWSATVRHLVQRGGAFIDRVCHTAGLRRQNVLRCNRRYAKDRPQRAASSERALSRIPAVDHFADIVMFDKFASVCRRQAFIDFARKPVVVIQQAFDRLLHKRFRRAALLRRYARQFSLLVRGQLYFHA